ncbi:lipocalin family protein [Pontibacter fetidus]|uniref:Lipocalin-like domain-containing protein n=1 Tax=Pontibacter fetidus TaxID=2700082 RepID=A0A6B2H4N6_9BACT|nr:lipocalin family protein [Pontibacter fetidus]NDK57363.1 hypothetical protein [Pontibacter fetidus]
MKNKALFYLMLLLSFAFVTASCSKSEDPQPSKEELLTEKTWKISRIMRDDQDVTYQPDMLQMRSVRAQYQSNGTYTETTTSNTRIGTWRLIGNTLILFQGTPNEENWNIDALTEGSLQLTSTIIFSDGSSDIFTLSLVHVD